MFQGKIWGFSKIALYSCLSALQGHILPSLCKFVFFWVREFLLYPQRWIYYAIHELKYALFFISLLLYLTLPHYTEFPVRHRFSSCLPEISVWPQSTAFCVGLLRLTSGHGTTCDTRGTLLMSTRKINNSLLYKMKWIQLYVSTQTKHLISSCVVKMTWNSWLNVELKRILVKLTPLKHLILIIVLIFKIILEQYIYDQKYIIFISLQLWNIRLYVVYYKRIKDRIKEKDIIYWGIHFQNIFLNRKIHLTICKVTKVVGGRAVWYSRKWTY